MENLRDLLADDRFAMIFQPEGRGPSHKHPEANPQDADNQEVRPEEESP